jgi:hypothetical protein
LGISEQMPLATKPANTINHYIQCIEYGDNQRDAVIM